ncbi:hypothetical protein ACFQ05_20725 [Amycolatopsis umgeniensis]|uniref:Uncharacterized protein n=1 Tax=Amycolatopsis umgeniensis TaxID=336628 RepID=A0A841BHL5_9PSEU|nr:hypothetical protein [Amycolatopsis umgeniensis]MBB5858042.1 hypothetical protein [Amycolatopsis umgeniensis]
MGKSFYDSDRWDWFGGRDDVQRRERIEAARLGFTPSGRELRLTIYEGDRKAWWVRVAPDGTVLSTARRGRISGQWSDPAAALEAAVTTGGGTGFVQEVERRVVAWPAGAASALGRIDGVPWECELDRYGLLTLIGPAVAWADDLASASDPVAWLAGREELSGLTEGRIVNGDASPEEDLGPVFLPAQGVGLPAGKVPDGLDGRIAAPGRELRMSGHERASERWSLHVLADGTLAGGSGRIDPASPESFQRSADPAAAWLECFVPGDPDFWTRVVEVLRVTIPAPGRALTASYGWLGDLEISAGGEVVVAGREGRALLDLLLQTGLAEDPFGAVRRSPSLLAGRVPGNRPGLDGVVVTLGERITPYTSAL